MCDTIYVSSEEHDIRTVGELRARYTVFRVDTGNLPDDACLCGVDVEAVLIRSNVEHSYDIYTGWVVP